MYCTVLYCTVLYCTVLYCTVLYRFSTSTALYQPARPTYEALRSDSAQPPALAARPAQLARRAKTEFSERSFSRRYISLYN